MREETPKKVTQLKNEYTKTKTLQTHQAMKVKRKRRRNITLILAVSGIFILALTVRLWSNVQKLADLEAQHVETAEELAETKNNQQELNSQIGKLKDEEYIAKLARSQYYLSKENELVFSFPEDNASNANEKEMKEKQNEKQKEQTEKAEKSSADYKNN